MTADIWISIAQGIPLTIALTLASFFVGVILGIPLCAIRISDNWALRQSATWIITIIRSVPTLVWLFLIFFGIGSGLINIPPFAAATCALGLLCTATMAEIYRGALSSLPLAQHESMAILGLSKLTKLKEVLAPQVFKISLPSAVTFLIGLLKDSAIASTIGITEISFNAYQITQTTLQGLDVYAVAAVFYIAISIVFAIISRKIEKAYAIGSRP